MSLDKVIEQNPEISPQPLLDHSVLANHALYDGFYFSTVAERGTMGRADVWSEFLKGGLELYSQSLEPYLPVGQSAESVADSVLKGSGGETHKMMAGYQMTAAPFNVNSTSVEAWKAILASLAESEVVTLWAKDSSIEVKQSGGIPVLGMTMPNGGPLDGQAPSEQIDDFRTNEWNGYRQLTEVEIQTLAEEIVEEVRTRGPFLSMSEFVNRRVGTSSELSESGALEAAIRRSGINDKTFENQVEIALKDVSDPELYQYQSPEVTVGNPAEGGQSWISQGDILKLLEPGATVRSDTFVVRTVGEAWDTAGNIAARAYAEAVVQRYPDYVDPSDDSWVRLDEDPSVGSEVNRKFGRRIRIVSFRWLSPSEI